MKCHLGYIFEIIKVFFDPCAVDAQELIGCGYHRLLLKLPIDGTSNG